MKKVFGMVFWLSFLPSMCLADLSFGVGIGQVTYEGMSKSDVGEILWGVRSSLVDSYDQDNKDTAFRVLAAYDILDWLDVELAYTDYGKSSFSGEDLYPVNNEYVTSEYRLVEAEGDLDGFSLSFIPKKKYPNGIEVNAKFGALMWKGAGDGYRAVQTNLTDDSVYLQEELLDLDDDGVDFIIGVGASYSYFTIGYERVSINSSPNDLIMLGVKF